MSVLLTGGGPIPSQVNFVNYIESTGTQYIDTGYYPKWNTRVVADVQMTTYSAIRAAFGCRNDNSSTASLAFMAFQTGTNKMRSDYFGSSLTLTLSGTTDQRLTIDKNKNVMTVGGVSVTNTAKTSGESTYTMLLFSYHNSASVGNMTSMKLYSCQIYEGDVLVHDYKPCFDPNGVACLYDLVNEEYVYNSGTGDFIAGGNELGQCNVTVKASDSGGYLSAVLKECTLTVNGTQITAAETSLELNSSTVEIKATMASTLSKARAVSVNGTSLGSVQAAGSSVSTTIQVEDGDTINIVFTM